MMGYSFELERKKMKRMGIPLVILALVALAFAFPMVNIKFRGLGILGTDSPQTVAFFESHVPLIGSLNMLGLVVMAALMYVVEYQDGGMKKMETLPVPIWKMFLSKALYLSLVYGVMVLLQGGALVGAGKLLLAETKGLFDVTVCYSLQGFVLGLPIISFMLVVSALFENLWVPLGVGVFGYLSGSVLPNTVPVLLLIHPFYLYTRLFAFNGRWMIRELRVAVGAAVVFLLIGCILSQEKKIG
jgi:hypothetical protein